MRAIAYGISLAALMASGMVGAQAADLIIDAPVAPGVIDVSGSWDGAYVGVFGGYGWGNLSYVSPDIEDGSADYDEDVDGFLIGLQAGYNFQQDQLVFGVQTDMAFLNGETVEGDSVSWLGTTTGRVGVAFDSVLLYGEAGLAYGLTETSFTWDAATTNSSEWGIGWTAGAGVEVAISEGLSAFAEYNYVDISSNHFSDYGIPIGDQGVDITYTSHIVKAGLNLSF
jgi:outer membrane immunogenic protein